MYLYVQFNETVMISSTWSTADWDIYISGYIPPYSLTWSLNGKTGLTTTPSNPIRIDLDISSQLYGFEELVFKIKNPKTLLSGTYGTSTDETGIVYQFLDPQDDESGYDCETNAYRGIMFAMLYVNIGLAIALALFLQSTASMFHLMGNLQICKSFILTVFSGNGCHVLGCLPNLFG